MSNSCERLAPSWLPSLTTKIIHKILVTKVGLIKTEVSLNWEWQVWMLFGLDSPHWWTVLHSRIEVSLTDKGSTDSNDGCNWLSWTNNVLLKFGGEIINFFVELGYKIKRHRKMEAILAKSIENILSFFWIIYLDLEKVKIKF